MISLFFSISDFNFIFSSLINFISSLRWIFSIFKLYSTLLFIISILIRLFCLDSLLLFLSPLLSKFFFNESIFISFFAIISNKFCTLFFSSFNCLLIFINSSSFSLLEFSSSSIFNSKLWISFWIFFSFLLTSITSNDFWLLSIKFKVSFFFKVKSGSFSFRDFNKASLNLISLIDGIDNLFNIFDFFNFIFPDIYNFFYYSKKFQLIIQSA